VKESWKLYLQSRFWIKVFSHALTQGNFWPLRLVPLGCEWRKANWRNFLFWHTNQIKMWRSRSPEGPGQSKILHHSVFNWMDWSAQETLGHIGQEGGLLDSFINFTGWMVNLWWPRHQFWFPCGGL